MKRKLTEYLYCTITLKNSFLEIEYILKIYKKSFMKLNLFQFEIKRKFYVVILLYFFPKSFKDIQQRLIVASGHVPIVNIGIMSK